MTRKAKQKGGNYVWLSVITVLVFLLIWEMCTDVLKLAPSTALPSPVQVVKTFIQKLWDPRPDGATLIEHMESSVSIALTGYVLGNLVGIPLGILMAWNRKADMFIRPLFDLIKPIPGVAWVPLTIVFFGIGMAGKAMVIFMSVFVSCVVNSYSGIRQTRTVHLWVARTFGASNWELLFRVALPSALPMIFTGLRVSLAGAWSAIVAAELIASTKGLGFMIQQCRGIYRPDVIIAGMIAIGLIGAVLTGVIGIVEKRVLKGGRW